MADTLTPLLLDAKQEYTSRLKDIIGQRFFHYFHSIYESCTDEEYIIQFQESLRKIPFWSSSQVSVESSEIVHKHPYFENLMAAVIVTYVKVLSSIRLSDVKPNVQLKLPTVDEFVHELYKQMAGLLYASPFIFEDENVAENFSKLVDEAIERSIRRLIPFDDILASYLSAPPPEDLQDSQTVHTEREETESDSSEDDDDHEIQIQTDPSKINMPVNGDRISSSDDDDEDYNTQMPLQQSNEPFPMTSPVAMDSHVLPQNPLVQAPKISAMDNSTNVQVSQQPVQNASQIPAIHQLVPGGREML
jgi:hypothetical protein